jgi:hypothetical protein
MAGEHGAICELTQKDANAEVQIANVRCTGVHEKPPCSIVQPRRATRSGDGATKRSARGGFLLGFSNLTVRTDLSGNVINST